MEDNVHMHNHFPTCLTCLLFHVFVFSAGSPVPHSSPPSDPASLPTSHSASPKGTITEGGAAPVAGSHDSGRSTPAAGGWRYMLGRTRWETVISYVQLPALSDCTNLSPLAVNQGLSARPLPEPSALVGACRLLRVLLGLLVLFYLLGSS